MGIETAMILAGGLGTRFKEYTKDIPKPMINANGVPLLVHIINFYATFDVKKIYVLAGYKKKLYMIISIKMELRYHKKNKFTLLIVMLQYTLLIQEMIL